MKTTRFLSVCVTLLLLVLMTSACSSDSSAKKFDPVTQQLIVDCAGREVAVPKAPKNVATLFAVAGHFMILADEGDKIVATSNGLKRDVLAGHLCPSLEEAVVVSRSGAINFEEMLKLEVDLALVSIEHASDSALVRQFDKYQIPFLVVDFNSIEEQIYLGDMIGKVFGKEERTDMYGAFYQEVIESVTAITDTIEVEDRVRVYHSINEAICTVSPGTLPEEWMKLSGGIDVSLEGDLEADGNKYYTTLEEILMWDAQIILCNEVGVDQYILENSQWQSATAVRNNQVRLMPNGFSRWGHTTSIETPLAILWTVKQLYPERSEAIDLEAYMVRFYEEMFRFKPSDELIQQILANDGMRLTKELESLN